jgi:hypothetical protein
MSSSIAGEREHAANRIAAAGRITRVESLMREFYPDVRSTIHDPR